MIIVFPGTKGEIEESSTRHKYHSSITLNYKNTRALIDLGVKYNPGLISEINDFDFILITHAHPDHYIWTLENEERVEVPVYLTRVTFDYAKYKPKNYRIIEPDTEIRLKDLRITAYRVLHSLRCPAVAYKIKGDRFVLYAPDIVDFELDKSTITKGVDLLIADGSSLNINMVRRKGDKIFGHTSIRTTIGWCKKYGINKLIITHCGKQVVTMDENELDKKIAEYSEGKVEVKVAYDNWEFELY
jgi:ribonuclease BN (tRNA processing enzyme)